MAFQIKRTQSARDNNVQGQQYLYRGITHLTPEIKSTVGNLVYVGVLPAYSIKQETIVRLNTTFTAACELEIGTSDSKARFATTADVDCRTADTYVVDRGYGFRSTVDVPVYVRLTTGSTAIALGGADIWISYLKGDSAGSTA
jgi:hypothetical protein